MGTHTPIWTPTTLELPKKPGGGKGRLPKLLSERRKKVVALIIKTILDIRPGLSFRPGTRGWCYLLEGHGLPKGDFDAAQTIISDARKDGRLPVNICADDDARSFHNLEILDDNSPEDEAESWIDWLLENEWENYKPFSFWEDQEFYVEVLVEKIDLLQLFKSTCKKYHTAIGNSKGWPDINGRFEMMLRFKQWEGRDKKCVLLICGDFDPAGLLITNTERKLLNDLSGAAKWKPDNLIIERFGLNADLIKKAGLTWIDNLQTSSGKNLASPKHPDHFKSYVQDYIKRFGARKVEGNALVTRPDLADELIKCTLNKFISLDSLDYYQFRLKEKQLEVKSIINEIMAERHA